MKTKPSSVPKRTSQQHFQQRIQPVLNVTIQAALFSALSTTLAQSITAYQSQPSTKSQQQSQSTFNWLQQSFDPFPVLIFMLIAIIMTPPNYIYQRFLEDTFPSQVTTVPSSQNSHNNKTTNNISSTRLSKSNTIIKLLLDQTIGAMANTAGFIILAGILSKGRTLDEVLSKDLKRDFWGMLTASWRVWPTVSLVNLVLVPFDYRMIVGNVVGVCWGVYVMLGVI